MASRTIVGSSVAVGLALLVPNAHAAEIGALTPIADLPLPRAQHIAVSDGAGIIYVGGGYTAAISPDGAAEFWAYDTAMDVYNPIANHPGTDRGYAAALSPTGEVVVFGGIDLESYAYDPAVDSWSQITTSPNAAMSSDGHWRAAAVTDGTLLYLIGGEAHETQAEQYDFGMDSWGAVPAMPTVRLQHGAAFGSDGNLYVIGGTESTLTMDVYDPVAGLWSAGTPPPSEVATAGVASDGDFIVVFGGSDEYGNFGMPYYDAILIYDIALGTWDTSAQTLPIGTRDGAAAYDGGYFYFFGGSQGESVVSAYRTAFDSDEDGISDFDDNCVDDPNMGQENTDTDMFGDVCDNCPDDDNDGQEDVDGDTIGDACDNCPDDLNFGQEDGDKDGVGDQCDNCPDDENTDQADEDEDGIGNACDPDFGSDSSSSDDGSIGSTSDTGDDMGDTTGGTGDDTGGTTGGGSGGSGVVDDTGLTGPLGSTGGGGDDGSSGSSTTGGATDADGCGCSSSERGREAPTAFLLMLLLQAARRRRENDSTTSSR